MRFAPSVDRRNTSSIKWDKYGGRDILPMWVADMDFPSPPSVLLALRERIDHGVFGYTHPPVSLIEAVRDYARKHYRWTIDADWIVWLPGLVQGLNLACRSVGVAGDAVVTATPVYPPFLHAPGLASRTLTAVPLVLKGRDWSWDFAALEAAITDRTRLLLICHPHNPIGRPWHPDEIQMLLAIARKHNLVVCSDEIHCDLLLDEGMRHTPFAAFDPQFQTHTITLMAPSKTWNIAGLGCAFAIIPDRERRARFIREMGGLVPSVNLLGYTAAEAAYRDSGEWHKDLIETLRANRQLLIEAFAQSPLKLTVPQATYLAWIDASSVDALNPLPAFECHGVGVSDGRDFGLPGWVRLNFGCSTEMVNEAIRRLAPLLRPG